ncbi:MAG TPA: hypothetical protein VHE30_13715 [Polyangiaceae bacterium]|nr:hypothetical protein [Polyangiaceae bacterium]
MADDPDYEGFLDGVHHGRVSGWARDKAHPERRVRVVVRDYDTPVAEGLADLPRPDVASDGKGDGRYGFSLPLPVTLLDGGIHNLYVTPEDSEVPVGGCPRPFGPEEGRELLQILHEWRERSGAHEAPPVPVPRPFAEKRAAHGRVSAYILIHDDAEFLRSAVASVADFADEIVLCDGGYRWEEPFLAPGRRLDRSRAECFEGLATATFSPKVRHVRGVWEDEAEKRTVAYESCSGDFVYVVEPDEVHVPDEGGMDAFLGSGKPVGTLLLRDLVTDRICRRGLARGPGRLFDRHAIGASEHLAYLASADPRDGGRPDLRYRAAVLHSLPVGAAYRLGRFRDVRRAAQLSVGRWLGSARVTRRVPWAPASDLAEPVDLAAAVALGAGPAREAFALSHPDVLGFDPDSSLRYRRIEVAPRARRVVADAYKAFRRSLGEVFGAERPVLARGVPAYFDVSADVLGKPAGRPVSFTFDGPVSAATVAFHRVRFDGADVTVLGSDAGSNGSISATISHRELDGAPFRVLVSVTADFPRPAEYRRVESIVVG